jgi:capsular exopolysaccharide synthesis family protein
MSFDAARYDERPLGEYLRTLWRRKWLIVGVVFVTAVVAYAVTSREQAEYKATANIVLTQQDLLSAITGTAGPGGGSQPDRLVQTLSVLARVPVVAQRALAAAHVRDMTADELVNSSSVGPKTDADVIDFDVTNPDPAVARRLATAYAAEFRRYREQLDTSTLSAAQYNVKRRLDNLAKHGQKGTALYGLLLDKSEQLQTLQTLQSASGDVVHPAGEAVKLRPKPMKMGMLGAFVGLLVAVGLVFLAEALDTRVRGVEALREALGLPILARVPRPPRAKGLVMLSNPHGVHAEPFRILRSSLDLANRDHLRTIMFTSASDSEGKSTTLANFAVALARAGRSVVIVDGDSRHPSLHSLFRLAPGPGLTDVVLGKRTLDKALRSVAITDASRGRAEKNGNGSGKATGVLHVLPAGSSPIDPELVGTDLMGAILRELQDRFDWVLLDAPPLLHVGDALALSSHVQGIVVVARLSSAKTEALSELRRALDASPAQVLGVVATGVKANEVESGYYSGGPSWTEQRLPQRIGAPARRR